MVFKKKEKTNKKGNKIVNLKFYFSLSFALITFGLVLSLAEDFFVNSNITSAIKWCCYLFGVCIFSYYSSKINDNRKGTQKIIVGFGLVGLGIVLLMLDKTNIISRIAFSLFLFSGVFSFYYGLQEAVQNLYLMLSTRKNNAMVGEAADKDFKWIREILAILLVLLQIIFLILESTGKV